MGKSAPTPPPAPDPSQIIGAETNANQQSALLQSQLNNVNYEGPQGVVSYSMDSPDRWTENVQLNPTEQATYDTTANAQYRAAKVADQQILNVSNALQNSNLQVPGLQTGAPVGKLQTGYDSGGRIQYGFNPGGAIQSQVAPTYSPFSSLGAGQGGSSTGQPQPQDQPQASAQSSDPKLAALAAQHPDYNSAQLQILEAHPNPGAKGQAAIAAAATPAGQASPAASSQPSQPAAGLSGPAQNDPYAALASNPVLGTQLATYAQAKQALDPQWRQASEQQQAQLAAQGLNPNSAAYQNAMQIFGDQENEAYNSALYNAINAGDAEQNTLFGQNLSAGQFANSAQLQNYQENQGLAAFNNSAQAQANAQNAAAAAFNNQALGQNWQEQYQNAQLANQAAQQQFQDQAYATQLPINEFTALMGNTQVAMPPSAPAQNTPVQPANPLGAYALQQNALQNDYDEQMQNNQSGLTGLFNLGSAALKTFLPT